MTDTATDDKQLVGDIRLSAEQGNVDAQFTLGLMYAKGYDCPQDLSEAMKWYRLAAEQGNAFAQYNLGDMYKYGIGVSKSDTEAIKWYQLAADQAYLAAQNNIDWILSGGQGEFHRTA